MPEKYNEESLKKINEIKQRSHIISEVLKSISNENKLIVICHLLEKEKTVGELTELLQISQPAVSQMLAKMKEDGILCSRQESQKVLYKIKNPVVIKIFEALSNLCCRSCSEAENKE